MFIHNKRLQYTVRVAAPNPGHELVESTGRRDLSADGGILVNIKVSLRFAWHHLVTDLEGMEDQIRVWTVEVKEEGQLWARHGLELEGEGRFQRVRG